MKAAIYAVVVALILSFPLAIPPAYSGQALKSEPAGSKGYLELECNIIGVELNLCPRDQFEFKTVQRFFGLFTFSTPSCTGQKIFLGTTPLKPIELPEGSYVLFIPPDYAWEHKGPIEVHVAARQKNFFLLKLFKRNGIQGTHGADGPDTSPGGTAGGGSGTGGGPGTSPP
jgi:uncharacterized membrane protein YgcG